MSGPVLAPAASAARLGAEVPGLRIAATTLHTVILETVSCLPPPVQLFASRRIVFIGLRAYARGLALRGLDYFLAETDWLVVLDEGAEDMHRTVAHEIAHCWLGHADDGTESERLASEQTRVWGWWGFSADPVAAVEAATARALARRNQDMLALPRGPRLSLNGAGPCCGYCGRPVELFAAADSELLGKRHVGRCRSCEWCAAVPV